MSPPSARSCTLLAGTDAVVSIAWARRAPRLAAATDARLCVFDLDSGDRRTLSALRGEHHALALRDDGERVAVGRRDTTVWSIPLSRRLCVATGPRQPTRALVFSPNGTRFAVAGGASGRVSDRRLWVFEAETGEAVHRLQAHEAPIVALGFIDDATLVSVDADQSCRRWDLAGEACVHRARLSDFHSSAHRALDHSVALDRHGERAASFVGDLVVLWDTTSGRRVRSWPAAWPTVALSGDGRRVARVERDRFVVTDAVTDDTLFESTAGEGVGAAAFAPDGSAVAWSWWGRLRVDGLPANIV